MNRVIHAAVRRDLGRFERALGDLSPGDTDRVAALGRAWDNFCWQLDHHHHAEHDIVWPALTAYGVDTGLLAEMDAEHGLMAAALGEAQEGMAALRREASARHRDVALAAVGHLRQVTEGHLEHEEQVLEPVLLGDFAGTPGARAMDKQLGAGGLRQGATMLSWLADGAGPAERRVIEGLVPAPVRMLLLGTLGRGYRRDVAAVWA